MSSYQPVALNENEEPLRSYRHTASRRRKAIALLVSSVSIILVATFMISDRHFSVDLQKEFKDNETGTKHNEQLAYTRTSMLKCAWAPHENEDCQQALEQLVCPHKKVPRLLFLGDSTMHYLWEKGLQGRLMEQPDLSAIQGVNCAVFDPKERCSLNEQLGLPFRHNRTWTLPTTFEGPTSYGLRNPYCQDCSGCWHTMLECKADEAKSLNVDPVDWQSLMYGGFLGVEFARDVSLQTDRYPTTQENVAAYIEEVWNDPALLQVWDKPVCLVNTGHHDASIPDLTTERYVQNVKWYMNLLLPVCRQFVWVATTSTQGLLDKDGVPYPQTIEKTKEWGDAVHDMLATDPVLAPRLLFIDDYNTSLTDDHKDNIHMRTQWYRNFGEAFPLDDIFRCNSTTTIGSAR